MQVIYGCGRQNNSTFYIDTPELLENSLYFLLIKLSGVLKLYWNHLQKHFIQEH